METVAAYLGALMLFVVSAALIKGSSPFSRLGSTEFADRRNHRALGHVVLVLAALVLAMGVINQLVSAAPRDIPTAITLQLPR